MKRINFILAVVVSTFGCSDDSEVTPSIKPTAKFSYESSTNSEITTPTSTYLVAPATVRFKNESESSTEFAWNFADGNESDEANPEHIFEQSGKYEVSLMSTGEGGVDFFEETVEVVDYTKLVEGDYVYTGRFVTATGEEVEDEIANLKVNLSDETFTFIFGDNALTVETLIWKRIEDRNDMYFSFRTKTEWNGESVVISGLGDQKHDEIEYDGWFSPHAGSFTMSFNVDYPGEENDFKIYVTAERN